MRNLHLFIILGIIMPSIFCSCRHNDHDAKYTLNYLSFENEDADDDEYGLIGIDGETYPEIFDKETSSVINGFFAIEEDDYSLTLCRFSNGQYTEIASGYEEIGVMSDGLIPVSRPEYNGIQILNSDGEEVFTLSQVNGIDVVECYSYSSGIMRVLLENEEYVYIDTQGNNPFNRAYDWASDYKNGFAVVRVHDDDYQIIDSKGNKILSFSCDDEDDIIFSGKYHKLAAKEDGRCYLYDFNGTFSRLPKMIEKVYALLEEEFIIKSDDLYGLMAYDNCKELIMAKYDQLVPNGKTFLAVHKDNDEIVKVIDQYDRELGELDGEEIYSPIAFGYSFPNIIVRPDDRVYLVDENGNKLGDSFNIDFDIDELEDAAKVHNTYFPEEEIIAAILRLCGDGRGCPNDRIHCMNELYQQCTAIDIPYFRNQSDLDQFRGEERAVELIEKGVNYMYGITYGFDEPIVKSGQSSLNQTAWLKHYIIEVGVSNIAGLFYLKDKIVSQLKQKGCSEIYHIKSNYILKSNNSKYFFVVDDEIPFFFYIYIYPYSESLIESWKTELKNLK